MRKFLATAFAVSTAFFLNAQTAELTSAPIKEKAFSAFKKGDVSYDKGKVTLGVGYGFPSLGTNYFSDLEDELGYTSSSLGPLFFKVGYAASDSYEIGLNVNFSSAKSTFRTDAANANFTATSKYSSLSALIRLNKHFATGEKFDPYWTTSLGYRTLNFSTTTNDPDYTGVDAAIKLPFSFEVGIGARYYFTPNIGIYAEAGISRAPFQIGLAAQF
ncbi:MAG: hypothetical protein RL757_2037 [Bacteroidota bacterium]|jgi:hypothetical protein